MDLSVIIPSRNEPFLSDTVEDILGNSEADTEVLIVEDGPSKTPPIMGMDRVRVIRHKAPTGQRASVNEGVMESSAKFIMKADAHCAFDKGFDRKLMAECERDWTVIPLMYNLHVFDWVCRDCKSRMYQSPRPAECKSCKGKNLSMEKVWRPKRGTPNFIMGFDSDLIFQYLPQKQRKVKDPIVESMSFLGACWMCRRDRYLEMDGLDEKHGVWGQVGTEVSCKTWLSGGRLMVNRKTWFAHMFRSQFGWQYSMSQEIIDHARAYSRDYWFNGKWPKRVRSLKWLVDKFSPVPGWENFNWRKEE